MGYQESVFVCENKKNFEKLCSVLNSEKSHLDDYVTVFAIARLKASLHITDSKTIIPPGSYFVWLGGERHPFQSGSPAGWCELNGLHPQTPYWNCISCERIANMDELLCGIDLNEDGIRQENAIVCLFELPEGDSIKDEYIKEIS